NLDYPEISPNSPLFHGTSPKAWKKISQEGLKPMGRDYVHLSRTRPEALRVGRRHHSEPILLKISPAVSEEISLYRAGPVVLAPKIPPRHLDKIK
ncbi:MAG: RNA 2'-phosphotransferase, partial [bacterium]